MTHGPAEAPNAVSWLEKWMKTDVRTIGARVLFAPNHSGVRRHHRVAHLGPRHLRAPAAPHRDAADHAARRLAAGRPRQQRPVDARLGHATPRSAAPRRSTMVRRESTIWVTDPAGVVTRVDDPRIGTLSGPVGLVGAPRGQGRQPARRVPGDLGRLRPGPDARPNLDSMLVEGGSWSDRNTHHWDDWSLESLLAAKAGQAVSLVVPARNEAATVGDVVTRVREALVDTVALLDEIVVIDSDSTDATYDVATDAGAVVHRSAEIRPDLGTVPGKGEAMWKSLFVTGGRGRRVHGRRPARLGHPLRRRAARPAAHPARGPAGQGLLRAPDGRGRDGRPVRGRPGHRARRPAADPAALPRARRACTSRWRGSGRSGGRCSRTCTCRPATPSSWPRSSTPSGARARRPGPGRPRHPRPPAPVPARPQRDVRPRSSPRRSRAPAYRRTASRAGAAAGGEPHDAAARAGTSSTTTRR